MVAIVAFILGVAWPREINRVHGTPALGYSERVVQDGENAWTIGRQYVSEDQNLDAWVSELSRLNRHLSPYNRGIRDLWPGDVLTVPIWAPPERARAKFVRIKSAEERRTERINALLTGVRRESP
ncbi:MAG: LysM peptidoglycan-binding domain-containing protein [bacterium]|nr:LysM peptidoglycan-binding domain-containing protein [bacterium]